MSETLLRAWLALTALPFPIRKDLFHAPGLVLMQQRFDESKRPRRKVSANRRRRRSWMTPGRKLIPEVKGDQEEIGTPRELAFARHSV